MTGPTSLPCPHCQGTGQIQPETMGQRMRAVRLARGLSTNDIVSATENAISQGNYNHLEAGRHRNIRIEVLEAIANALSVDAGYLLTGKGVP